jgi:hypothetical protein
LGVDHIALDEALKNDPRAERIKIFLPTTLEVYTAHYRKHAQLGTITAERAEELISQLVRLKKINPEALIENPNENFNEETKKKMYYDRNMAVVEASDELMAFPVKSEASESLGTEDTITKAKSKNIPVKEFRFDLTLNK